MTARAFNKIAAGLNEALEQAKATQAACMKCRFAKQVDEAPPEDSMFECRRHAPWPVKLENEDSLTEWGWPLVSAEEWCGEFAS